MRLHTRTPQIVIGYGRITRSADAPVGEMLLLTEEVREIVAAALRVAADVYRQDAVDSKQAGIERLVEQFTAQARDAMALAGELER